LFTRSSFFHGKSFQKRSVEFVKVTPSLPQRGRQPKGASPLDPPFQSFIFRYPLTVCSKKARADVTPSARGSIAIEFGRVVRISNEQFFLNKTKRFACSQTAGTVTTGIFPVPPPIPRSFGLKRYLALHRISHHSHPLYAMFL